MNQESEKKDTSRSKMPLIALLSLLGILGCLGYLYSDQLSGFFKGAILTDDIAAIGNVFYAENDVRHRTRGNLIWEKASRDQSVRLGDSIFTASNSTSKINLINGTKVDLGENSLVTFNSLEGIHVPNLELGNFKITVNQKTKIAIGNNVTEIDGNNANLQITIDSTGQPQVRLIGGNAKIKIKGTVINLTPNQITAIPQNLLKNDTKTKDLNTPMVDLQPAESIYHHTEQMYDFYEMTNDKLVRRHNPRLVVSQSLEVKWNIRDSSTPVFAQLSPDTQFVNIIDSGNSIASVGFIKFKKMLIGENYYRVSSDGKNWSSPQKIIMTSGPLNVTPPSIKMKTLNPEILAEEVIVKGHIDSSYTTNLIEASEFADFPIQKTHVLWTTKNEFAFAVNTEKTMYLRARGVNPQLQITALSATTKIDITKPSIPLAPTLARNNYSAVVGTDTLIDWAPVKNASKYLVQIKDSGGKTVWSKKTDKPEFIYRPEKAGNYALQIMAQDSHGRNSAESAHATLHASPNMLMGTKDDLKRKIASQASIAYKPIIPMYLNREYKGSKISFEGAALNMISQDQMDQNQANPVAMMLGVRWMKWVGNHGVEGSFKTKVTDVSSGGSNVSPMLAEGRYHHRWNVPFNLFSKIKESQISLIGGYEYYRNPSQNLFSPGYDLFKTGFTLAMPLASRWDTGGEMLYGQGLDSSWKYEIAGFINYYIETKWSLGFGYRMHLFEAGSASATPLGLPYREGLGEGYSVLRWHY